MNSTPMAPVFLAILSVAFAGSPSAAEPQQAAASGKTVGKKLIEFGWDEPDTAFMREHIQEMQATPFDGCVFHVNYTAGEKDQGNFTWACWGARRFTQGELEPALRDLKSTRFGRFNQNFLRFNTTPARLDWFDDHSAVLENARLAAWLAREGGCPGVLFDIEQYDGHLFDYRAQRDRAEKSWELYAAQCRRRGREVMQAFQAGFPGLRVFLTFGYSLPWSESRSGKKALAECSYGLLAPFLDGMVQATEGTTRLVDGYEISYGYKDVSRFGSAYETMKTGLLPIVSDPEKYERVFSFGFGVWLDHDWRKAGWDTTDLAKNSYTPEAFERSVRQALVTADEYVWVYSETPRWWSKAGGAVKLPQAYVDALRRARE